MLVFIDDSGDPGFKILEGSSSHFVIACIIFEDNLDAEETALKIKRFRRSLGWRDDHEFKFNKANQEIRLKFLNEIKGCKFKIRAIVCDKSLIRSSELQSKKSSFYNYMIKQVLAKSDSIKGASVRLDGHEDRAYKQAATTYFRQHLDFKNLKFVNSKNDNLIQLADMIAGSIFRSTQSTKTDSEIYLDVIRYRVDDIWDFK